MSRITPATKEIVGSKISHKLYSYDYDPDALKVGLQAAEALGAEPGRVLKTLMVLADGRPACAILASDKEVAMKRLAVALGARSAQMMKSADAERITGYKVGGISPFGQKKRSPVVLDAAALRYPLVFVNGGQRGLQVELSPADLGAALGATVADIG